MVAIKEVTHQGSRVFQENSPERFGRTNSEKKSTYRLLPRLPKTSLKKILVNLLGPEDQKLFPCPRLFHFNNKLAYILL